MSGQQLGPVVCVSYLAHAALWKVLRFPQVNHGAEVRAIERSIAADAPMAAAVLAALEVPTLLLANDVGHDPNGAEVCEWLERYGVSTMVKMTTGMPTPQIVVVADEAGTRTWFPYLPGVIDGLAALDLTPIDGGSFVYVDCYQLIEGPVVCAVQHARTAGTPLLVNLGGSPLTPSVAAALRSHPQLLAQTNIDDADHRHASRLAEEVRSATGAQWAIVTAGAAGAVALSQSQHLAVPAFRASVRHTHCAGAAFSGGLLYGLLHDWPMEENLRLACASGALRCERAHHEAMPTLEELYAVIGSRERIIVSAA
jgi:sugar/nucleoside kinase (ribokinase family)